MSTQREFRLDEDLKAQSVAARRDVAQYTGRARPMTSPPGSSALAARIEATIDRQLRMMADDCGRDISGAPFAAVRERATHALRVIGQHLQAGRIRPWPPVRLSSSAPVPEPSLRPVRLGVYPVTANPLHWGHLLAALGVQAALALDQVVFIVQGVDPRKPLAARETERDRHEMARQAIALLEPLAAYSDIGLGNARIGEENLFHLLRLNHHTRVAAHYIVGADHYRQCDAEGRPDTLPMLRRNMSDPAFDFDDRLHNVQVAFIQRGELGPAVPTPLDVQFVPEALNASSTRVRHGDLSLVPHVVAGYLATHPEYATKIGLPSRF